MNQTEWFREQSGYSKKFYERLHANRHDLSDWKVILLFYSALTELTTGSTLERGVSPTTTPKGIGESGTNCRKCATNTATSTR